MLTFMAKIVTEGTHESLLTCNHAVKYTFIVWLLEKEQDPSYTLSIELNFVFFMYYRNYAPIMSKIICPLRNTLFIILVANDMTNPSLCVDILKIVKFQCSHILPIY